MNITQAYQSYFTEFVNIDEFKYYVNYIEEYETSFNVDGVIIPVNIINLEQIKLNDKLIKSNKYYHINDKFLSFKIKR